MIMSVKKELESLCYNALKESPKLKKEVNKFVVDKILYDTTINSTRDLILGLSNLGFCLESLKKFGVTNTANCSDANEGLYSTGTWFIKEIA